MDITSANFYALVNRFNYTLFRKILKQLNISFEHLNKSELPDSLARWACSADITDIEKVKAQQLLSIFQDNIIYANKIIEIYTIDKNKIATIESSLSKIKPDGLFVSRYGNNLATQEDLKELHKERHYDLWRVISSNQETHLVFTTIRDINNKEELSSELFKEARKSYDEIFGVNYIYTQCFDVITLYKDGTIDIKIDYYRSHAGKSQPKLHKKDIQKTIDNLKDRFSMLLKENTDIDFIWEQPFNFKSVIGRLTSDPDLLADDVKQTDNNGYITSFGSIGRKDVREGVGYFGANSALLNKGDIPKHYYYIGSIDMPMGDNGESKNTVFLELSANPTLYHSETSMVKNAIITGNLGYDDYHMLRRKLLN